MSPGVSVVIPLYNKGPHITRAIKSVLTQTCQDFEIVVVNDGSTDDSVELLQQIRDSRIHLIHQANKGVSAARNRGVESAASDFIAFLDADDEWTPDHLETLLRLKETFPGAGAYTTAYTVYLPNGAMRPVALRAIPSIPFEGLLPDYFRTAALGEDPVNSSVVGIPKKIFQETGGFQVGDAMGEDLDLWAKIALRYPIALSSATSAVYHMEASNRACESYHSIEELPGVKNGKKAIADGTVPQRLLPWFKEYIARREIDTAVYDIFGGDYLLARKILARTKTRCFRLEKGMWMVVTRIPKPVFDGIRHLKNRVENAIIRRESKKDPGSE